MYTKLHFLQEWNNCSLRPRDLSDKCKEDVAYTVTVQQILRDEPGQMLKYVDQKTEIVQTFAPSLASCSGWTNLQQK